MVVVCLCVTLVGSIAPTPMAARASDGWLPDATWGPWERFSDPSGKVSYDPRQVAVDSEGRFVVLGYREDTSAGTRCPFHEASIRYVDYRLTVGRYLPDGRLDTSFGSQGLVTVAQYSQFFEGASLVVSGNDIYVAAYPRIVPCGTSEAQPLGHTAIRIPGDGQLDGGINRQVIWRAPDDLTWLNLDGLPDGAAGGFSGGIFVHLSAQGATETDLREVLCSGEWSWSMCSSIPLASRGDTVASARLTGGDESSQSLAVLFGNLRGKTLVPDERVGGSGVLEVDLAPVIGSLTVNQGSHSNWLAFDQQGRLTVMMTAFERYRPGVGSYARALITARFVPDPQEGWVPDPTYGTAGLDRVDLPMEGADTFAIEAFGVDAQGRPLMAGIWHNFSVDDAGNFIVRLTESGDFDRSYGNDTACIAFASDGSCSALGSSGITWMPPNSFNIRGRPALDNRDNVYFSSALSAFGSRSKKQAPYRLGRIKPKGVIQVHDGRTWQNTRAQPSPRLQLDVERGLPSTVSAGRTVWVTVRVTLPSLRAGKVAPVKGAAVSVMAMGPRGPSDRTPVASARTDARGYARLRVTVKSKGSFAITAEADGYVGAGSDPVQIKVTPRSLPRSGEPSPAYEA